MTSANPDLHPSRAQLWRPVICGSTHLPARSSIPCSSLQYSAAMGASRICCALLERRSQAGLDQLCRKTAAGGKGPPCYLVGRLREVPRKPALWPYHMRYHGGNEALAHRTGNERECYGLCTKIPGGWDGVPRPTQWAGQGQRHY